MNGLGTELRANKKKMMNKKRQKTNIKSNDLKFEMPMPMPLKKNLLTIYKIDHFVFFVRTFTRCKKYRIIAKCPHNYQPMYWAMGRQRQINVYHCYHSYEYK